MGNSEPAAGPLSPVPTSRYIFIVGIVLLYGLLVLARLGHYALWDDEAITALAAKGVLRTGDTSVLMDHGNIVAYRNGWDVKDFCDHSMPPLDAYVTAASFGLFGINTWSARLPFALAGVATIALVLFWARRESWPTFLLLAAGLLGNVSLILYFRQCRYYALAVFFSVAIVYVYWRWKPAPRPLLALAGLSVLLFVSNYINYLALYACLAIDWFFWKRKEWPLAWRDGLLLFLPQVILNGIVACIWNPLLTPHGNSATVNSVGDRLTLFLWYWRDLNQCEFFVLPVLLLALGLGLVRRRLWVVRGCLALLVYLVAVVIVSPQPVHLAVDADVRYLPAVIPLAISLETFALCSLLERRKVLLALAAALVFGTNVITGGWLLNYGLQAALVSNVNNQQLLDNGIRVTILNYIEELISFPPEPYSPVAQWINDHVPEGDSIWVLPDYATYPLMLRAPKALYAWQLSWPPRPDFAALPPIHFIGQEPPDYLIAFGPSVGTMVQAMKSWNRPGLSYAQEATLNIFWKDLYRPELFWRTFRPVTNFDPNSQAIFIFKRTSPPITPSS